MNKYQFAELDVLKAVIKLLNDNNLRYFAIGGTGIGAIRHNGFIPWDDDIDIAMPRKDYEIFRTKIYKKLPSRLKLLDYDNCIENDSFFIKVHDSGTTMIDLYAKDTPDRYTGAFIDIMPIDGLPCDKRKQEVVYKKMKFFSLLNYLRRDNSTSNQNIKKIAKNIIGYVLHVFPYNFFSNKMTKEMSRYDFDNSEYCFFSWRICDWSIKKNRLIFCSDFFSEVIDCPFEDIYIKMPMGYDCYLNQDFGNYLELPSVEERNSGHHPWIYDVTKPVEYYRNKKIKGEIL